MECEVCGYPISYRQSEGGVWAIRRVFFFFLGKPELLQVGEGAQDLAKSARTEVTCQSAHPM